MRRTMIILLLLLKLVTSASALLTSYDISPSTLEPGDRFGSILRNDDGRRILVASLRSGAVDSYDQKNPTVYVFDGTELTYKYYKNQVVEPDFYCCGERLFDVASLSDGLLTITCSNDDICTFSQYLRTRENNFKTIYSDNVLTGTIDIFDKSLYVTLHDRVKYFSNADDLITSSVQEILVANVRYVYSDGTYLLIVSGDILSVYKRNNNRWANDPSFTITMEYSAGKAIPKLTDAGSILWLTRDTDHTSTVITYVYDGDSWEQHGVNLDLNTVTNDVITLGGNKLFVVEGGTIIKEYRWDNGWRHIDNQDTTITPLQVNCTLVTTSYSSFAAGCPLANSERGQVTIFQHPDTQAPTAYPTASPSVAPTASPVGSSAPTEAPTRAPTMVEDTVINGPQGTEYVLMARSCVDGTVLSADFSTVSLSECARACGTFGGTRRCNNFMFDDTKCVLMGPGDCIEGETNEDMSWYRSYRFNNTFESPSSCDNDDDEPISLAVAIVPSLFAGFLGTILYKYKK